MLEKQNVGESFLSEKYRITHARTPRAAELHRNREYANPM